jgi:mono/diheme cytochrome c family protein
MVVRFLFPAFALTASFVCAQDGGQLFATYCAACHGTNGEGAAVGQFPPLAGSPWVKGEPERAIKIVLHGLHGPIEVNGKSWNLEMPPQGALLADDRVAAILSYVRTSWDNQAGSVTAAEVKAIRDANANRKEPWTTAELLKHHPLPLEKTALMDLTSQIFTGTGRDMPDFSRLTATNVEEEHNGIISRKISPHQDHFVIVWQGTFQAPVNGEYEFYLDADDAATVTLDGKRIVDVLGIGPMNGSRAKTKKIKLTKGSHPIRVEYLEFEGVEGIALAWRAGEGDGWHWLSDKPEGGPAFRKTLPIGPENGRPVIYRNFIQGTTPRAIGVGFPNGANLAWSADNLAPELLWTGAFIDGSFKWQDRGMEPNPPAGDNLVHLSDKRFLPEDARFKGYQLDPAGNPTFIVKIGDQILKDSWQPGQRPDQANSLIRNLSLTGGTGTFRIPLGPFKEVTSEVATETRDGIAFVTLIPGRTTTHIYQMSR